MQLSKMYYFHLLVYAGLNPKLPDFMLPKKKKAIFYFTAGVKNQMQPPHDRDLQHFLPFWSIYG